MKGLDRWLYPTVAVICSCFVWLGELEAQTSLVVNRFQIVSAAGTAVENCQGLKSALASIMDAANDNPYTIRLEPGEYDCGAAGVVMKPYVDVEGSGEGVTRVFGDLDSFDLGVVQMANESELRFLTVERTGSPTTDGIAVSAKSGESRIVHARLVSGEALFESCGVFVDDGATVYARDSSIEGAVEGVQVATGGTAVLAYSELINGYANSGTLSCVFSHDDTLKELDASCDPLP